jgi:hypothetical protein
MLNAESSHYNSEFKNAVKKEMDERIERGRSVDDPDLIFDCAAIVKATNPRFAQSLEEQANNEVRRKNNGESGFTVRKVGTETVGTPNARQLELAKKWNMPEDFLKQHMKSKSG